MKHIDNPRFEDVVKKTVPIIKHSELLRLIDAKKLEPADLSFYVCNECGSVATVNIYCCKNPNGQKLNNFTRIAIWFKEPKIMRVDEDIVE